MPGNNLEKPAVMRVPDARFKDGYRLTPEGKTWIAQQRSMRIRRRRFVFTVIVLFVLTMATHSPFAYLPLIVILGVWFVRRLRNRRQEELARKQPVDVNVNSAVSVDQPLPPLEGATRSRKPFSAEVKRAVYIRDGGRCRMCLRTDAEAMLDSGYHLELDHIIPFSRNGADTVDNLQLLCRSCNAAKGNRYESDLPECA